MKTIKINSCDKFLLWNTEYNYCFFDYDKEIFLKEIKEISKNKDTKKLKDLFYKILKRQNKNVVILEEDLFWLLQYFLAKFL